MNDGNPTSIPYHTDIHKRYSDAANTYTHLPILLAPILDLQFVALTPLLQPLL